MKSAVGESIYRGKNRYWCMGKNFLFHEETIFSNPEVFDFDFVPEEFMFRSEQMGEIASCIKPALRNSRPVNCMLNGVPATVKTTSIRKIFEELDGHPKVIKVYLNCRMCSTTFRVYSEIHKKLFGYTPPESGVSITTIYNKIFEALSKENKVLIVVLDDCVFLEDCDEVIYQLSRAYEVCEGVKVGVIAVLSEKEKYIIEDKAESVFCPRIIDYEPYGGEEIVEILKIRAKMGFYEGVINDSLIETIAGFSVEKDLRFAIELLRQSGIETENNSAGKIKDLGKQELSEKEEVILKILSGKNYSSGDLYKLVEKKVDISYSSFYRLIDKLKKKKLISVTEKATNMGRTRIIKKLD